MSRELPESLNSSKLDTEYNFDAHEILKTFIVQSVTHRKKVQKLQLHMFFLSVKEYVIVEDHQRHQKELL